MRNKLLKGSILLLCISTSCHAASNKPLQGTWSSKCASDGSGNYNIETFVFKNQNAIYMIQTYSDASCHHKISTLNTYRNYKPGKAVPNLANTKELDYTFKSVTMTYNDPSAVNQANKSEDYGFSNWKINESKEVAGLKRNASAYPEHAQNDKFYTIVKIEKDKLFMGDYASGKGISPNTRLSAIYNVPFNKSNQRARP